MIDGLKPYPAMRDSGVPWLGAVPEHWEVLKLKRIARLQSGQGITAFNINEQGAYPVFGGNGLRGYTSAFTHEGEYVLIGRQGALCGNINYAKGRFWASEHAVVAHPRCPFAVRWLGELPRVMDLNQYSISAAQPGLAVERIEPLLIPFPPFDEQFAIARYLDHTDRIIRRYVGARRKLIRLLEEQKQTVVHRAVTRGLDPNVRLKPSGIEWLGEVPEHWEVIRLGRVIADGPKNGISPPVDERGTIESFSISAIRDGKVEVRPEDRKYIAGDKVALEGAYQLLGGDVLLVRGNGNIRLVGKAAIVERDMPDRVYPDLLMRVRLTQRCLPRYMVALLNSPSGRDQIETAAKTAVGTFKINNQHARQFAFALPPLEEQQRVIDWLADKTELATSAAKCAKREIALLQEYRTRLIADVVTGKLDVRAAAAALPEAEEEAEVVEPTEDAEIDDAAPDEETEAEEAQEEAA